MYFYNTNFVFRCFSYCREGHGLIIVFTTVKYSVTIYKQSLYYYLLYNEDSSKANDILQFSYSTTGM